MTRSSEANLRGAVRAIVDCGCTPTDVCNEYGVTFQELHELVQEGKIPFLGRFEDYQYIISLKRRGDPWPNQHFRPILNAKDFCDRGLVNLTCAYSPDYIVMYAFPTVVKQFRKPWFFGGG